MLDNQGYEAVLTIEASDEPHGVLNFASSSRVVLVQEENKTIQLFINREFGLLGLYLRVVKWLRLILDFSCSLESGTSSFFSIRASLL